MRGNVSGECRYAAEEPALAGNGDELRSGGMPEDDCILSLGCYFMVCK